MHLISTNLRSKTLHAILYLGDFIYTYNEIQKRM